MIQTRHPVYRHDCDSCIFLGAKEVEGRLYDFYFCPNSKSNIARYSSDGPGYFSLPQFLAETLNKIEPYKTCLDLSIDLAK
jgi:hypothetical protein